MKLIDKIISLINEELELMYTTNTNKKYYEPNEYIYLYFTFGYEHSFSVDKILDLYQLCNWTEKHIVDEMIRDIREGFLNAYLNKKEN